MRPASSDAVAPAAGRPREPILTVRDLRVRLRTDQGVVNAVNGVSFAVHEGEAVGVVGESGSGKSVTFLAVLGLLSQMVRSDVEGEVLLGGRDLTRLSREEMRRLRGRELALIFQDPLSALNPLLRVGVQIAEVVRTHEGLSRADAFKRAVETLELVGIPRAAQRASSYPFEFSGGMRQRVMIALAIAGRPRLLIADEPTTALDVTIQAQILDLLDSLRRDLSMGVVLITHDLGLVARHATRVAVMYAGKIMEEAPVDALFARTAHPYSWSLLSSLPRLEGDRKRRLDAIPGEPPDLRHALPACPFQPRCPMTHGSPRCVDEVPGLDPVAPDHVAACHYVERVERARAQSAPRPSGPAVAAAAPPAAAQREELRPFAWSEDEAILRVEGVSKMFALRRRGLSRQRDQILAVDDVSFDMRRGETLGVVGESGSGKSTLARLVLRLHEPTAGRIVLGGRDITDLGHGELRRVREDIQVVFQDPKSSLNPRMTVQAIVGEPLVIRGAWDRDGRRRVAEMLERVGLSAAHAQRYPHEFSGGQQQRIGLARALILRPAMLVLDEPISSLDVSIQAQVINLLMDLQSDLGLTYIFIAHDLSVVYHISDRIAVMYLGRIVELADAGALYDRPLHPYTEALLTAIPRPDPELEQERAGVAAPGSVPSLVEVPPGCPFHTRCRRARAVGASDAVETREVAGERLPRACVEQRPALVPDAARHWAACHFAHVDETTRTGETSHGARG